MVDGRWWMEDVGNEVYEKVWGNFRGGSRGWGDFEEIAKKRVIYPKG
jgi:hypothetical protein